MYGSIAILPNGKKNLNKLERIHTTAICVAYKIPGYISTKTVLETANLSDLCSYIFDFNKNRLTLSLIRDTEINKLINKYRVNLLYYNNSYHETNYTLFKTSWESIQPP